MKNEEHYIEFKLNENDFIRNAEKGTIEILNTDYVKFIKAAFDENKEVRICEESIFIEK